MSKITNLLFATLLALPVAGQTVSQDRASLPIGKTVGS